MSARDAAVAGIQAAVNRLLALDPELAEDMGELEGSVFEIHVLGVDRRVQLHVSPAGIALVDVGEEERTRVAADVIVSGPPFTLLRLLVSLDSVDGVLPAGVSISGELALVQRLAALARRTRLDWEEPLSRLLGDTAAHEIGRGVRALGSHLLTVADTLGADVGEYLREERRLAPTRIEVEDFAADVDRIRDDVERLEARVGRLNARPGGGRE